MGVFDDISLEWGGKVFTIPSRKVMGAIARIEDVVTLAELARFQERQTAPLARIAMAYAAVLRYAGATVEDDEVYAGMFGHAANKQVAMLSSLQTLMAMMIPPAALPSATKESPKGNASTTAPASSRKRSRQRSAPGE